VKAATTHNRSRSKRRACPREGCGRVWYALADEEPDVCPACRLGPPLAAEGSGKTPGWELHLALSEAKR
jgi:hypothetical protein